MAEYISRDVALEICEKYGCNNGSTLGRHSGIADCIANKISNIPAADVAPVRRSFWESYDTSAYVGIDEAGEPRFAARKFYVCHNRKCRNKTVVRTKYCSNCGARMDGGANNGN